MSANTFQDLPAAVYWAWCLALAEAVLVFLPLTIYSLRRALQTARRVQHDMKEMAEAGARIIQHSASLSTSIRSLDTTTLVQLAESLHAPPVQAASTTAGPFHAGNGNTPGGI